jgi:hypothetical protein
MSTELFSQIDERLRLVELLAGQHRTPQVEVTRDDLKALRAEIATLKSALATTQGDLRQRTANPVTRHDVAAASKQAINVMVPVVGDAILQEQAARQKAIKDTLGSVHAEITSVKNAAAAQAQHSADFLRASAAHFARG